MVSSVPRNCGDLLLELTMDRQRAAQKAHGRNAITVLADSTHGGFFDPRMRRQSEIIVRRQHDDVFAGHADDGALLGFDEGFFFERLGLFQPVEFVTDRFVKIHFCLIAARRV